MEKASLKRILTDLSAEDNFVFLETRKATSEEYTSYLFKDPLKIISTEDPSQLKPNIDEIESLLARGCFAAGFLSYEAGFALEEALKPKPGNGFPLAWFGLYKDAIVFDNRKIVFINDSPDENYHLSDLNPGATKEEYIDNISKIKSYIEKGDTYQINYTFKLGFSFKGSVIDLYLALRKKQSVSYSALIRFGEKYILSFSPELFFRKDKAFIQVKPMKGTIEKGRFLKESADNKHALELSPKDRSENIMIVDLLRNDLGKISKKDTVKTKRLFEAEEYESLFQMTSTIESRVNPQVSLYDLLKAIFPSGSVTGAPKISSMNIIDTLENQPRLIYTGSIGFISPKKASVFNVAIRTLLIDTERQKGEMGIGSGVVYDSDPEKEYAECILKANFLTESTDDFKLIETMLWDPYEGYPLMDLHLERLKESSAYFGFAYNRKEIIRRLQSESLRFEKKRTRVRLLLDAKGNADMSHSLLAEGNICNNITFSAVRVSSSDRFLFHKTTNRRIYDEEYKKCKENGFYDIIFQNEKGEITEGAISNIFIKSRGRYFTPPVECGLLNGVYRRHIIKDKIFSVEEKVLYCRDIEAADEILLTNAVRGIISVKLAPSDEHKKINPDMVYV